MGVMFTYESDYSSARFCARGVLAEMNALGLRVISRARWRCAEGDIARNQLSRVTRQYIKQQGGADVSTPRKWRARQQPRQLRCQVEARQDRALEHDAFQMSPCTCAIRASTTDPSSEYSASIVGDEDALRRRGPRAAPPLRLAAGSHCRRSARRRCARPAPVKCSASRSSGRVETAAGAALREVGQPHDGGVNTLPRATSGAGESRVRVIRPTPARPAAGRC